MEIYTFIKIQLKSITDYRNAIKELIDSTDNEFLLRTMAKSIRTRLGGIKGSRKSTEELSLVQEGMLDYENGHVLPLEEFVGKTK